MALDQDQVRKIASLARLPSLREVGKGVGTKGYVVPGPSERSWGEEAQNWVLITLYVLGWGAFSDYFVLGLAKSISGPE